MLVHLIHTVFDFKCIFASVERNQGLVLFWVIELDPGLKILNINMWRSVHIHPLSRWLVLSVLFDSLLYVVVKEESMQNLVSPSTGGGLSENWECQPSVRCTKTAVQFFPVCQLKPVTQSPAHWVGHWKFSGNALALHDVACLDGVHTKILPSVHSSLGKEECHSWFLWSPSRMKHDPETKAHP